MIFVFTHTFSRQCDFTHWYVDKHTRNWKLSLIVLA